MDFATTEELINVFQDKSTLDSNQMDSDVLQMLIKQYLFSIGPDTTIQIKALCGLARELGWKHIGIIIANSDATQVDTQEVYFGDIRYRSITNKNNRYTSTSALMHKTGLIVRITAQLHLLVSYIILCTHVNLLHSSHAQNGAGAVCRIKPLRDV
jgi:hypothetical protein